MLKGAHLVEQAPTTVRPVPILVAIALTWVVVVANQNWVWGVVMVAWAVRDIVNANTTFLQLISRRRHPVTYWIVVGSWMAMGIMWLLRG